MQALRPEHRLSPIKRIKMMTSDNAEHRTCGGEAGLRSTAPLMADSLPRVQIRVTGRLRVTHTATCLLALGLLLHTPTAAAANPSWRILALVYQTTDFSYRDAQGVDRRVVGGLSAQDLARADAILRHFVEVDVPRLSSGNQFPSLTVRIRPVLGRLTQVGQRSWYPAPTDLGTDRDPTFDTIIIIWQTIGIDQLSGRRAELSPEFGGLAYYVPRQQTFVSASVFGANLFGFGRNLLKHEWGHNILMHYAWTGAAPKPAVDNHIDNTNNRYVNCVTGASYTLVDETDAAPIPNSIYNNDFGFTHDYYSGTTATADNPQRCLGITAAAWATGGPVSKPRGRLVGDFDGDGRTDLTVYRPNSGEWFINPSTPHFNAGNSASFQWGLATDIPLKADFDGDGKSDLVVYRPSDGGWYIRYSSVGYALNQCGVLPMGPLQRHSTPGRFRRRWPDRPRRLPSLRRRLVRPLLLARVRLEPVGLRPVGPVHRQAARGRLRR